MHQLEGVLLAALAAVFYNAGAVPQAAEVRKEPVELSLRPSLLVRLAKRPGWLLATALVTAGWPLNALALALAPLSVVQPVLALGLLVLLWAGHRRLGEAVGVSEVLAVLGLVVGVALLAASSPGEEPRFVHYAPFELSVGIGTLALLTVLPLLVRRPATALAPFAAGAGFALSAITTKLMSDRLAAGALLAGGVYALATGVASLLATLAEMSAFQERPASRVCPTVFATQAAVPVVFGVTVLHERSAAQGPGVAVLVAGLAILVCAVVTLARLPTLAAVVDATSGACKEPSTPSRESAVASSASVAGEPS
ncbi:hypothetical protein SAMN02745716_2076 [Thermoleophilum album]|uniref:Magnesium transporter NIPA n=1 Tax=Thermoleophilum album TaxID=29539 RepID=A0A1H6G037_THEAL|nr:hypothetical protein SAMN02745716_2076 [Thermoleophilum album]